MIDDIKMDLNTVDLQASVRKKMFGTKAVTVVIWLLNHIV